MLSATAIVLLYGPRVGSPASLAYFVGMNRPVATVSKMPMDARTCSLKPSRCGMSCVFKVCVVETVSLNCTMWPLVYSLGVVWTEGWGSHILWLAWVDVAILFVLQL